MALACLERDAFLEQHSAPSPSASQNGNHPLADWAEQINRSGQFHWEELTKPPLQEELALVNARAQAAVSEQVRYLSRDDFKAITEALNELLSPEYWDEDDEVLRLTSVRTMLKAIIALNLGAGDFTVSRVGNLVCTWSLNDKVLRLEAKPDVRVAWTVLYPRGAKPRHEHHPDDSIDDLTSGIANL